MAARHTCCVHWDASVGLSLTVAELPLARAQLIETLAEQESPEARMAAGLIEYLLADFAAAQEHLQAAFLGFRQSGNDRRAALAASHIGRVEYDGLGRLNAANGWYSRAGRLVSDEPPCLEQGWVALGRVGCSFVDSDELESAARRALRLANEFGEVDLECKALADLGLALVGHGRTAEGATLLDEAMTMVHSGECANAFIASQVYCCIVSSCERSGDLSRMDALLTVLQHEMPGALGPHANPNLLLAHCEGEYGSLLCGSGRWREAEVALRRAVDASHGVHYRPRARAYAALADLRVSQGRLPEAAEALQGYTDSIEAQLPLARLHLARGDHDLSATVARRAVRTLAGDTMRAAPLLACLVDAELARGELDAARAAATTLAAAARNADRAHIRALAHLVMSRTLSASDDISSALTEIETGLAALPKGQWPLIAAELHLQLAALLRAADRVSAIAEARAALTIFTTAGAVRMHDAQTLLHRLGGSVAPAEHAMLGRLTVRERQVLRLLAGGASNPDIARALVISTKTAEHHVSSILRKLQLTGRSEAAVYAATLARPNNR
jgi:DNA-binding CsgD family transcriptional regulator/tetratricopeptide (TPR) repeat protein